MARSGPLPKAVKHGHGGTAGGHDVPNVPYDGPCPKLPDTPGVAWFPQVEAWWEALCRMPHCVLWEPPDWIFALELAFLKNSTWGEYFGGTVHASMAAEIRRREDQMGMTLEARRKLGIRYIDVEYAATETGGAEEPTEVTDELGNVSNIDKAPSRRARLAG